MLESVEKRFGDQLPATPGQWLSDNGSAYIAKQTCLFARQIGLQPVIMQVHSPQSNGIAESFVKTVKRDYVAHMLKPDRDTALRNLTIAFEQHNEEHPHSSLNIARKESSGVWHQHQFSEGVGVRFGRGKSRRFATLGLPKSKKTAFPYVFKDVGPVFSNFHRFTELLKEAIH